MGASSRKKSSSSPSPGTMEILALQPAGPEWVAAFHDGEGGATLLPIACWCVIKEYTVSVVQKGKRVTREGSWVFRTSGMVSVGSQLLPADSLESFLGYDHPMIDLDLARKLEKFQPPSGAGGGEAN